MKSRARQLVEAITWERPVATHPDEVMLDVDVAKVDQAWAKDHEMYIGQGGTGNPKRGAYQGFIDYLQREQPIGMPQLAWSEWNQAIQFTNGRHRFAVMRDRGTKTIPVMIPKAQLGLFKRNFT
jgi:hypothetical protein